MLIRTKAWVSVGRDFVSWAVTGAIPDSARENATTKEKHRCKLTIKNPFKRNRVPAYSTHPSRGYYKTLVIRHFK
jgi:hypothetical protein